MNPSGNRIVAAEPLSSFPFLADNPPMSQTFSSQSTESFRQLLDQANCSLIVSTYQAGQLVLVRPHKTSVNTHFIAFGKPMGLALQNGQLAVGGAAQIITYRNLPAVGAKTGEGEGVDACYVPRRTHNTGAIDIHEMGYDRNGKLWFINTRMSCLASIDPGFSFTPKWRPPFITAYEMSDRCHLNGLGFRDGKPRYVTMLGATDTGGGWRNNQGSGGQLMDIDSNEVLVDELCMPHSPRWYNGKLWFLSSGAGQLMSVDPGKAPQVVAELPGFARALDFIDRYALIGLSQIRESAVFAGLPLTRRVEDRKSGVWVIDIISGETVAFLQFTGNVQEVFELKVAPHRFPTLLDLNSPLVATSFELPDEVVKNLAPPDPVQQALEEATRQHMKGKLDAAIKQYRQILAEHGDHRQTMHQLGLCLVDAEQWPAAVEQLDRVVAAQADNAEAMNSLGLAHSRLGHMERALDWFDQSIATDNQFAMAHFNRGLLLLKQGDYDAGWPEYDWRWQTPQFVRFQCNQPLWQGEDISDKRLLVHSEQGNGDHIQFMRFLPMVAERCKKLIYVGPERLAPLAAIIEGVDESRVPGQIPSDYFDVYCPLMSLPRWLGITLENLPAPSRYLTIPDQVVVSQLKGKYKVGLSWAGSPTQKDDKRRSTGLETLLPLLDVEGVSWFSLQMPISAEDAERLEPAGVKNLEPELPGYARTAALVDQLDFVISTDTAIAHLAGALGIATAVLINHDPDWRWGDSGETTPWYPSLQLFRQSTAGEWGEVIERIKADLVVRLANSS